MSAHPGVPFLWSDQWIMIIHYYSSGSKSVKMWISVKKETGDDNRFQRCLLFASDFKNMRIWRARKNTSTRITINNVGNTISGRILEAVPCCTGTFVVRVGAGVETKAGG